MSTKKLAGKTAVVTGAESGIGRSIAIAFARQGASVVMTYLHDQAAAAETLSAVQQTGTDGLILQADVSKEKDVEALFLSAIERFRQIDILVNCAGVRGADKYIHELDLEAFERTVRTNLFSVFLCCRSFARHRLAQAQSGPGRIINITSVHEEIVSPGKTDYCASKAAVRGLSRALAMELASKQITVNNIAPSMILTPMNQRAMDDPGYRKTLEERIPAKVSGLPEDIAKAALFLASDDAAYITGTTQVVDGGLILNRAQGAQQ